MWRHQEDKVVRNGNQRPVFLGAVPGADEELAESQMLLDVLVKELNFKAFVILMNHLLTGKVQIVGDKKSCDIMMFTNKLEFGKNLEIPS